MYVVIVLITFIVFAYTDKHNIGLVLGELIGLATALLTVGAWQARDKKKQNNETKE